MKRLLLFGLLLGSLLGTGYGQEDPLRSAKALFFDHRYAEARTAWQAVERSSGPGSEVAAYWIARCSEALGESERAFAEYGTFLAKRPDPVLRDEAVTGRVGIACKLYKAGTFKYLPVVSAALRDPSKTVRYFAALQLSTLPPAVGREAVAVLQRIVSDETDPDLVDRAKLSILRLDPKALSTEAGTPKNGRGANFLRVRITKAGSPKPEVSINIPVALADLLFKSLPDNAREDLRKRGFDAPHFWERMKALGPTSVVHIEGDDGEIIDIWLE